MILRTRSCVTGFITQCGWVFHFNMTESVCWKWFVLAVCQFRKGISAGPALQGGPEPLENEINKFLDSKHEDRFSDHFPDLVQTICSVRFSYLLRLNIFCKAPQDMRKFPQKCQKIAGCWMSAVYGSRPPIASKPDAGSRIHFRTTFPDSHF